MKQTSMQDLLVNTNTEEICLQPQYVHTINDIQTFEALCDEQTNESSTDLEMTKLKTPISLSETVPVVPSFESDKPTALSLNKIREFKKKQKINLEISLPNCCKKEDIPSIPFDSTVFNLNEEEIRINVNQLHGKKLSQGQFGSVHLIKIKSSPDISIAVKHSNLLMISEVKIFEAISAGSCQYIVDYYCALRKFNTAELYICMELMDTSIQSFYQTMHSLKKIKSNQIEQFMRRVIHDVASGLFYLEIKEILHRDIKPENLLINKNGSVKLCDFGLSRSFSSEMMDKNFLGDANYMPPNLNNSIQDDMWAFGVTLFEILNGKHPFRDDLSTEKWLIVLQWQPNPSVLNRLSINLQELILHLLKQQASERPQSYLEILNKPSICNLTETLSNNELHFIRHIIKRESITCSCCIQRQTKCTCVIT